MNLLIGRTGYVGSTLAKQHRFDVGVSSVDIATIENRPYDLVVCAGAPGAKWIADGNPAADLANLQRLATSLATITAEHFVLISTVDVFADSRDVDEESQVDDAGTSAYGRNRMWLERFVRDRFPAALILRLPGLVGPGLRKNALFDLHNSNALDRIDARAVYQFYPMVNLWPDLAAALAQHIRLLHLTSAPLSVADVARAAFGIDFRNEIDSRAPARYDFQTLYATALGGSGRYTYSARESLLAIRAFALSESRSTPIT